MATNKNYSVHDDITARITFLAVHLILLSLAKTFVPLDSDWYLPVVVLRNVLLFFALSFLPLTPFPKDMKEILVMDSLVIGCFTFVYFTLDALYRASTPLALIYQKAMHTLFLARLLWPCRDENGDFVGWPVFGPVRLFANAEKESIDWPRATLRQTKLAYVTMVLAILVGFVFYLLGVTNFAAVSISVLIVAALFIVKKSLKMHADKLAATAARQAAEAQQREQERQKAAALALLQMQTNLDAQLAVDAERNRVETTEEELARIKAEKAAVEAKLQELQALQSPEALRLYEALKALPLEALERQIKVIEALKQEVDYFDADPK